MLKTHLLKNLLQPILVILEVSESFGFQVQLINSDFEYLENGVKDIYYIFDMLMR